MSSVPGISSPDSEGLLPIRHLGERYCIRAMKAVKNGLAQQPPGDDTIPMRLPALPALQSDSTVRVGVQSRHAHRPIRNCSVANVSEPVRGMMNMRLSGLIVFTSGALVMAVVAQS